MRNKKVDGLPPLSILSSVMSQLLFCRACASWLRHAGVMFPGLRLNIYAFSLS